MGLGDGSWGQVGREQIHDKSTLCTRKQIWLIILEREKLFLLRDVRLKKKNTFYTKQHR